MIKKIPLASLFKEEKFLLSRVMRCIAADNDFQKKPMADFSDILFVLPSREAGRLFRAKAAQFFKDLGGIISLNIILPEELLASPPETEISQIQILENFFEVLKEEKSSFFPDIELNDNTLLSFADYLSKVRENILFESGMDTADFINTLDKNSPLREKLVKYLDLEKKYYERIKNVRDRAAVILETLNSPAEKFASFKKIILIECTEMRNAISLLLEKLDNITVEHYLNVTEEQLSYFDACGRPDTDKMLQCRFNWQIEDNVQTFSTPIQEAAKIASLIQKDCLPDCIGVLNDSLNNVLANELAEKGIEVSNPAPKMLNSFYWSRLFLHIAGLQNKKISFEDVYFFASDESVLNYFKLAPKAVKIREKFDKLQQEHLISDLNSLLFFLKKDAEENAYCINFCEKLAELQQEVRNGKNRKIIENIYEVFQKTASQNSLENMDFNEAEVSLEALKNAVSAVRNIANEDNSMLLFRHLLSNSEISGAEQYKDNALTFSGFLDLIWYENNSLIIGGITEESFASASQEDMFFPENIRCQLKWSSAYSRFGADIHRFRQLLNQYDKTNLLITHSAADAEGTLTTLPRLFFNVDDEKLLKHCDLLFKNKLAQPTAANNPEDNTKFICEPAFTDYMPQRISVTSFKTYIECPYTFYLEKIRSCSKLEDKSIELNATQLGNLLHAVFEKYGTLYADSLPAEKELSLFLHSELDKSFISQIGNTVNNLTVMQNEVMHSSIDGFLHVEYQYRTSFASHKIHAVEHKIDILYGELYDRIQQKWNNLLPEIDDELRNIRLVGKIDRMDIAEDENGSIFCRITDYKTSGEGKKPSEAHFKTGISEHLDGEIMLAAAPNKYFADMQLIIYNLLAETFRSELKIAENAVIQCGYFNLPKDTEQTKIELFYELDGQVLQNGAKALHYLMQKIFIDKYFWPPSLSYIYGVMKIYFPEITTGDIKQEAENE
ncbi:MAG: PD-(D/E)XK nuclease family protein [Lentisphaeria bacterium]|nr:PD-(D/E)XK nuclease family protein [Lentisphaeria bacterium]